MLAVDQLISINSNLTTLHISMIPVDPNEKKESVDCGCETNTEKNGEYMCNIDININKVATNNVDAHAYNNRDKDAEMNHNNMSVSSEEDSTSITKTNKTSAFILSVGLLLHNLFEGMSIGLSVDHNHLVILLIAVCSHKVITAFSLGLSFYNAKWWDMSSICVMVIFTISGPFGTVLG